MHFGCIFKEKISEICDRLDVEYKKKKRMQVYVSKILGLSNEKAGVVGGRERAKQLCKRSGTQFGLV